MREKAQLNRQLLHCPREAPVRMWFWRMLYPARNIPCEFGLPSALPGVTCNVRLKEWLLMASIILFTQRAELALGMTCSAAVSSWAGCLVDLCEQATVL